MKIEGRKDVTVTGHQATPPHIRHFEGYSLLDYRTAA
jgi:hypothetical protein